MYLEILVLASLAREPAHGYELKRRIFQQLGGQVEINSNTLYPALRRFSTDGLVRSQERRDPGRPPRQVYRLTAAGGRRLDELLTDLDPAAARRPEEFWTRVAFFDLVSAAVRRRVLLARLAALDEVEKMLSELRERSGGREWPTQVMDVQLRLLDTERDWVRSRLIDYPPGKD